MKSHARVVVIGGGVIGCSVLYHLTKLGWTDVVLCERKELTAGSSWHAAGGFHVLNSDPNVAKLQAYTVNLYKEIEQLSGQDIGLHLTGGLNVAASQERWEMLRADHARHRVLGIETALISPDEIKRLCPLIDVSGVLGALFDPMEGHLDPYGTTHAYAKAARRNGAEIYRHTRVLELKSHREGWTVVTDKGTISAEHVINAGGLWARQVGHMVGVDLPVVAMEHHYLLTDDLPELKTAAKEIPMVVDLDGEIYLRQERHGVLLGVYEKNATPWAINGTPWDYGETELLPPAMDRLLDALELGFKRFPSVSDAGICKVVNGPFTFSPDGNPLVGPVPGLRNFWVACGVMAGFAQGGGVGLALSQWIVAGETETDVFAMDVARFGSYATRPYTVQRAREFYEKRFAIMHANENLPAGRPCKTTALYPQFQAANAVFGASYGLEVPLYYAPTGTDARENPTLKRSNAFPIVKQECQTARNALGLLEISSFAKYLVSGPDAGVALDKLLAGTLPRVGGVRLAPMLSDAGRLMGDFTVHRPEADKFFIVGSGYLQAWHMRWFEQKLDASLDFKLENVSDTLSGIAIFGPRSREFLASFADADVSNQAFPFMSTRRMPVGFAPAMVSRLSVTGELGYEIYVPGAYMQSLYRLFEAARIGCGGRWLGMYAVNSLRLEKGYGIWSREFSRDYTPRMAQLGRFVAYSKTGFVGRDAALIDRDHTPERQLVLLDVKTRDADAQGYEPIYAGKNYVGFTTSGGYGHCADLSLAMGYVPVDMAGSNSELTIWIAGDPYPARILPEAPIDPCGSCLRS